MGRRTQHSPTFPMYPGGVVAVTTSDTAKLTHPSVIYVGMSGNVRVMSVQGDTETFVGMQAGSCVPVQVIQVYATGTTATSLLAIY